LNFGRETDPDLEDCFQYVAVVDVKAKQSYKTSRTWW